MIDRSSPKLGPRRCGGQSCADIIGIQLYLDSKQAARYNHEAEGWQIEESPVHNAMDICHPHPRSAFDDGGLWMSRGSVISLSEMVDVMRRRLHAHLLAALPPQQLARPAPVARVHQSWAAYCTLFSVLFS